MLLADELPANDKADDLLAILYQRLLNTPASSYGGSKEKFEFLKTFKGAIDQNNETS